MIIAWALVYQVIEFASTIVMFKLFLYEEICQSGTMYCYVLQANMNKAPTDRVKQLTYYHGINPGKQVLSTEGIIVPWCLGPFGLFFKAAEQSLKAWN